VVSSLRQQGIYVLLLPVFRPAGENPATGKKSTLLAQARNHLIVITA
jgi:hypothetical protein